MPVPICQSVILVVRFADNAQILEAGLSFPESLPNFLKVISSLPDRRKPRPGASSEIASIRFVFPVPFFPTSTTGALSIVIASS